MIFSVVVVVAGQEGGQEGGQVLHEQLVECCFLPTVGKRERAQPV